MITSDCNFLVNGGTLTMCLFIACIIATHAALYGAEEKQSRPLWQLVLDQSGGYDQPVLTPEVPRLDYRNKQLSPAATIYPRTLINDDSNSTSVIRHLVRDAFYEKRTPLEKEMSSLSLSCAKRPVSLMSRLDSLRRLRSVTFKTTTRPTHIIERKLDDIDGIKQSQKVSNAEMEKVTQLMQEKL